MSHLSAIRRQLFGAPTRPARDPKPYDRFTKAELWARIEMLEARLKRARTLASRHAGDAHNRRAYEERDRFHEVGLPCDLSVELP
ncbi:MAG TPA: hypothetical protein VHG72_13900 [Polyangia bacterium]|nr:hypothetical protein [Polyangia bacterium]